MFYFSISCCHGNGKRIYTSSKFDMLYYIITHGQEVHMYISAIPPSAAVEEGFENIPQGLHV